MIIKRYIANNMNEAVTRIRYELGRDAVIISQRKIRKPGIKGFFSKKSIEVTAAIENLNSNDDNSIKESIEAIRKVMGDENAQIKQDASEVVKTEASKVEEIKTEEIKAEASEETKEVTTNLLKEMHEMKEMINNIITAKETENTQERTIEKIDKAPRKTKLQLKLESADISESVCKKITTRIKNIQGDMEEGEKLKVVIQKMIPISNAKMEGRVILVGPTGVGKTTTIAKLAGKLSLIDKKNVGLITVDTYRIGAIEQLKTYAEIMGLPFKVVITLKEMELALESMKECDVILIDTTGRSSKNTSQISELKTFIEKVDTRNIHLVISSTTKNKDIESILAGYKPLNYNNLIITKLDETSTYGSILNIIDSAKKPLSIVTTGQNVPDDIKNITAEELSNLILGVDTIC